jgi:hypothetical protein
VRFAEGGAAAGGASPAAVRLAEAALHSLRGARRLAVALALLLAIVATLFGTAAAGAILRGRGAFGPDGCGGANTGSRTTNAAR